MKTFFALAALAFLVPARAAPPVEATLPHYVRKVTARGTVRICGDTQGGLLNRLEAAFVKLHPNVAFSNLPAPSQLAVPGMILGFADLGIGGAPADPSQIYFLRKMGYSKPVEISIAGGSYAVRGRSAVLAVYVHRSNPIDKLTIGQLEGIFGEARNAGWKDGLWDPSQARGPEGNIRTWGQAGLSGAWAGKEIHTYGLSWGGPNIFMSRLLTGDSGKWNPNFRTYNIKSFAVGDALVDRMNADMAADPSCIGWTQLIFAQDNPDLKIVALAWDANGPYLLPSKETLANRTYPLNRDIYMYARLPVDHPQDEFLHFILSAEGQKIVADQGIFSPLTPEAAAEQVGKLQ
jgi:phosphate transport system substrate-binding protein